MVKPDSQWPGGEREAPPVEQRTNGAPVGDAFVEHGTTTKLVPAKRPLSVLDAPVSAVNDALDDWVDRP